MKQPLVIDRLNALSASWKAQFKAPPSIPLVWQMDEYGDLWLDGVKLRRAAGVDMDGYTFNKDKIVVPTSDGSIEIIIGEPVKGFAVIKEIITHKIIFRY